MHVKFFSLTIYLLPFAIVSGPFISDLIISINAIYIIVIILKDKIYHILKQKIIFFLLCFWGYIILSSLLSENIILSLESSLLYGRFIFFALSVQYLLSHNKNFISVFGIFLWACLVIVAIDSYIQFFLGYNILLLPAQQFNRISSFFGEELILGSFISRLIPLGFFVIAYAYKKNNIYIGLSLIFLVLTDIVVFLAGERAAFFYLFLSTSLIVILAPDLKLLRLSAFIVSLFFIILISLSFPHTKERMIDNTISDFGIGIKDKIFIFSDGHQQLYSSAIKMFSDNPITGVGPKIFRTLCDNKNYSVDACSTHPHNTYVQLLAETGIIGFLFISVLFLLVTKELFLQFFKMYIFKTKKNLISTPQLCILCALTISLWPFIPTGNFFNNWINVYYYFPLGFYLYLRD